MSLFSEHQVSILSPKVVIEWLIILHHIREVSTLIQDILTEFFSCFFSVPPGKYRDGNLNCEPGSSVSIVTGYGLDDRAIEVRSPAEVKGFFL
jgi:hypothetical protein